MTTSNRTPQSVSQSSLPPPPRLVTATTPSVASNTSLNTSKISIEKQHKTHHHHSPHHHVHSKAHNKAKKEAKRAAKVAEAKKSRVEHVIIEKRYRMKITDSLNELKIMLPGSDDKKVIKVNRYCLWFLYSPTRGLASFWNDPQCDYLTWSLFEGLLNLTIEFNKRNSLGIGFHIITLLRKQSKCCSWRNLWNY